MRKILSLSLALAIFFSTTTAAIADDFMFADEGIYDETLILDGDESSGGDVRLQFGNTLGEYLRWSGSEFSLSDDFKLLNMNLNGTTVTLDSDNASTGVDVTITAGQGVDEAGILKYDSSSNEWQLGNNGAGGSAIRTDTSDDLTDVVSKTAVVQVRELADPATNPTTWTDFTFDTTDVETNPAVLEHDNTNTDQIDVKEAGLYRITYTIVAAGGASHRVYAHVVKNDTTTLGGSYLDSLGYDGSEYAPITATFLAELAASDWISLQVYGANSYDLQANSTIMTIERVERTADASSNHNSFILDQDNTGGNVTLQFGTTLAETLTWDNTNSEFDLSDDLNFSGYLELEGVEADPTTDEGRMWYRSDTDNLMFYQDARLHEVAMTEVGQFYDSDGDGGSYDINTVAWTEIPWDSESFAEDATYSHDTATNNSRVTINDDGLYRISYAVHHEMQGGTRINMHCAVRLNGSTFPTMSAQSYAYSRSTTDEWATNKASGWFDLNAGDYYEVMCQRAGANTSASYLTAGTEGVSWTSIELMRRTAKWSKYFEITTDSSLIPADQTDFPVYFDMSLLSAEHRFWSDYDATSNNDLIVTNDTGNIRYPVEVVDIDESSTPNTGEIYFKVPILDGDADTTFRIYYDNPTVSAQPAVGSTYGAENVWTNDYLAVLHLHDDFLDSTSNDNDGTNTGSADIVGKIGDAQDFEGVDYIDLATNNFSNISDQATISLWQYGDTTQPTADFIFYGTSAAGRELSSHLPYSGAEIYWDGFANMANRINKTATASSEYKDQWNNWVFTDNSTSGTPRMYYNGSEWHSDTGKTGTYSTITAFQIGANGSGGSNYDGAVDEFRISETERSANWVQTEYNNQATPSDFFTVSP